MPCLVFNFCMRACILPESVLTITLSYVVDKTESKHNCKTVKYDQKGKITTKENSLQ